MAAPVLQFKRGEFANLPALKAGEPGFTTDKYDLYIGLDNNISNNKFFGSHRYWKKETVSTGSGINLVEGSGTGNDFITLAAPGSVGAAVTYYFPATQGSSSSVLTNDGSGNLSWSSGSNNPYFTGIATFSGTTDNVLGDPNTGAVQIDGGLGINKNLTVGANLNVQGYSEFVGVVTFKGGTINLGDANTDDINVAGEFISNLVPNSDATYDIGDGGQSKRWRNASFSGVGTFATGAIADAIQIGITASGEIDTSSGGLTLDSATGQTTIDDNLSVTGISTVTGAFFANGNVTLGDGAGDAISIKGTTTFEQSITGTISTATRATTIDTISVADNDATYYPTFVNSHNTTVATETVYTDGHLFYNPFYNILQTKDLILTGNADITGVTTVRNPFIALNGANISGAETILSSATVSDLTTNRIVLAGTAGSLNDNANLVYASNQGLIVGTGGANITGVSTFSTDLTVGGDIRINGNEIKASDGSTNITLTDNVLTTFVGDIRVNGNSIQASDGSVNIEMTSGTLTEVKGDLKVSGNDIQGSDGINAISLSGSGSVGVASDLTITGNLYVNGSTTQVNTTQLTVEDTIVELGLVNGSAPGADLNKDLGIILNYYTTSAKKSAIYWDDSLSRIAIASDITESSSVLTAAAYAALEIGSLWINDCAGQSQVISCTGSERFLENITIDGGSF